MPVTIKDVAKLANVAPSTVSRVIANNPKISDATKERVYKAMKELNYHPNAIARSLANKATKTIGLLLPNKGEDLFVNPFFTQVMRGISMYAQKKGYYIMYAYSDDETEEVELIKHFINSRLVDGLILTTAREDDKCIEFLRESDSNFVVIGKPEDSTDILWVDNDNFHAMYSVVNTLIQRGKRDIAFISGSQEFNVSSNRLEGYVTALSNSGIQIDKGLVAEADFNEDSGYHCMNRILDYKVPSALVTTDDLLAFGAMRALEERNITDISIVGFNNTPLAAHKTPSLTSVDINAEKLGYFAAKLLINKLNNIKENIHSYIIETELIERDSTVD